MKQRTHNIEITEKHTELKIVIFTLLFAAVFAALAVGIVGCLYTEAGWHIIESRNAGIDCSSDFTFYYRVRKGGTRATRELKSVTAVYSDACIAAHRAFDEYAAYEGECNVAALNRNPNTEMPVMPLLRAALEKAVRADRSIFFAPVYEQYYGLFYSLDDASAASYDLMRNAELREEVEEAMAFASDPEHVSITFGEGGEITLVVSDEYAAYAEEKQLRFIDFFALKAAFEIDYISGKLCEHGFDGMISTVDGRFTRIFGEGGDEYTVSVFDLDGACINTAAAFSGRGQLAAARFRSYQARADRSFDMFYTYADGVTVTPFVDPTDGLNKSVISDFLAYTRGCSCADVALAATSVYMSSNDLYASAVALAEDGVMCVYTINGTVYYTDADLDSALATDNATDEYKTYRVRSE